MTDVHKVLMLVENVSAPADRRVWPEATAVRDQGLRVSIISPKGILQDQESYTCIEGIHIYRYQLPTSEHKYLLKRL